jgi:hypothetical protein
MDTFDRERKKREELKGASDIDYYYGCDFNLNLIDDDY